MKVRDSMIREVFTCAASDKLDSAAATMWREDVGALVVIDANHKPLGIVTDRDICMAAYTRGCLLERTDVASLLGRPIIGCSDADTLESAAESMALHQVRRLPVIDERGVLTGVITLGDIARSHRMSETAGVALAIITTPRSLADPSVNRGNS